MDNQYSWLTVETTENDKQGVYLNNKAGLHKLLSDWDTPEQAEQARVKHEEFRQRINQAVKRAVEKLMDLTPEEQARILSRHI